MDEGSTGAALKRVCSICWSCKKSWTIKNVSDTALHKVYKVSPISATHKTEQFGKGVRWDFSSSSPAYCHWLKLMQLLWPVTSLFAIRWSARRSEMAVNDDPIHVVSVIQLNAEKVGTAILWQYYVDWPLGTPDSAWMTKRLLTDEAMSRVRCLKRFLRVTCRLWWQTDSVFLHDKHGASHAALSVWASDERTHNVALMGLWVLF